MQVTLLTYYLIAGTIVAPCVTATSDDGATVADGFGGVGALSRVHRAYISSRSVSRDLVSK